MDLEEVTAAMQKRERKRILARRFLIDPTFRQQHLEQLRRRAQRELLSPAPPREEENPRQPEGQRAEDVAVREVFDAQHQRRRETQANVAARVAEARTRIQMPLDGGFGGLAGTIRLRKTGMLPPPAERNRNADEIIAQGDVKHEELKRKATGILEQRMETARLAEEQNRQRRIVTFPKRSAQVGKQGR